LQHLPEDIAKTSPPVSQSDAAEEAPIEGMAVTALPTAVETLEKKLILAALTQTRGNKSRAAKLLQISERSLWYKIGRYGIKDSV